MRFLKAGVTLLAGVLMLATASSTFATLPDVHILSGEEYPATSVGSVTGKEAGEVIGKFETELGEKVTFKGMTYEDELLELSSLGPDSIIVNGAEEPKAKTSCNTEGSPAGTVVIPGERHATTIATGGGHSYLLLWKGLVIICQKLKVMLRSPVLLHLNVTAGEDVTSYGVSAKCSGKGKQDLREYLNDEEKAVKGQPTMNFGLGFETACMEMNQELTLKSSKMIDFLF